MKLLKLESIPKELLSNLVYRYSCGNCNVTYYDRTERQLKIRASEHSGVTSLIGKRVKCPKTSAFTDNL